MTTQQQSQQVRQFLDYWRSAGLEWDLAFVAWATSKHLSPDDYYAIRQIVHMELVALGELTIDELPEWAGDAGDEADDDSAGNARAAA